MYYVLSSQKYVEYQFKVFRQNIIVFKKKKNWGKISFLIILFFGFYLNIQNVTS